ncbi:aminopeptidase [Corynebacterium kutscheri]|uniref:aminopeptidase N n=1 Tax=Corynebacterium kutscheri TaxID=35755 RepID=UPI000F6E4201|nr:aminopeptidase N [Corynebacterium kutscheri]VEH81832.1 aminopeptidase [Corynebacterium kutscheri]
MTEKSLKFSDATHRSATLNINRYHINLDLSKARTAVTFPVTTTITLDSTTDTTFLDYLGEQVDFISINGQEQEIVFDGSRIKLTTLPTNTKFEIKIHSTSFYSRTGQGLHRFVDSADNETYLYSHLEPSDARRIYPCFDQPDLKAHIQVSMTVPSEWIALSNQPVVSSTTHADTTTYHFAETPPLSTYLTCFAAGCYKAKTSSWVSPQGQRIELGAWTRQSMFEYLDDEILEITQQGLSYFDAAFGFAYPWGKYDSIFVPEYNIGAMENPGLVTFTETYVFRSQATDAQHAARANTILHEMSHMWFGDLVTPQWWDDLWLKESFAEFMGADASVEATRFTNAWVDFAGNRKNWAYEQDQLPSTHPIKATINDVDAARQNFDGITYAKGASVLKQLVHFVGREQFYDAAKEYFATYPFSSATFTDLLAVLKNHTDRNLDIWSNKWLLSTGIDKLTPQLEIVDGKIASLKVHLTSEAMQRPHRIDIGLYKLNDSQLTRTHLLDVFVEDSMTSVADAIGLDAPDLVLLNDGDHTYAKIAFDQHSLSTALEHLSKIDDGLSRAVIWTALWNLTRDGQLSVSDFITAVLKHCGKETNPSISARILNHADYASQMFTSEKTRVQEQERFSEKLWSQLKDALPGSDAQLVLARSAISALAAKPTPGSLELRAILRAEIEGLDLSPDIRWSILAALAARDDITDIELEQELRHDNTLSGQVSFLRAQHSFPRAELKETIFNEIIRPNSWSNAELDALIAAYNSPGHDELRAPLFSRFFTMIPTIWSQHPIEIANKLIRGLYPQVQQSIAETDVLLAQELPTALRRILLECQDTVRRAVMVQVANH